jgi:predicted nucleic acid-binding protein
MRFLDANVFVYAYYKPRKPLGKMEKWSKDQAKAILSVLNEGREDMTTTVIHLSEVSNVLKHAMPLEGLHEVISGLFMLDNLKILGVSSEEYFAATELGPELKLDPNDALAIQTMKNQGITEIYSFDRRFEKVEGITRLPRFHKP